MARPDKAASVAELKQRFSNSAGAVLTNYRGLTVAQLKNLRRALGEDATYAVTKNTLTMIAAREAGVEGIDDLLVGPTAIAFIDGDPVNVARGLRDFARANPLLEIKGGVLDGKPVTPAEIGKLADLESHEVLLAKLAGAMQGTLQNAVSLFAAPLSQVARLMAALQAAAATDPSLIAAGDAPQEHDSEPSSDELGGTPADAAQEDPNAAAAAQEDPNAAAAAVDNPNAADAASSE